MVAKARPSYSLRMRVPRLKYLCVAVAGVIAFLSAKATVSQKPAPPRAAAQGVPLARAAFDNGPVARALRIAARRKAADIAWSALTAARREPKAVLKGIALTAVERKRTRWITEEYLDRSEELDKADKTAYRTATDTSTLLTDIAALRLQQRAAIRAALTPVNRVQYDANVALLMVREG